VSRTGSKPDNEHAQCLGERSAGTAELPWHVHRCAARQRYARRFAQ
jgi:hypothetical protein